MSLYGNRKYDADGMSYVEYILFVHHKVFGQTVSLFGL